MPSIYQALRVMSEGFNVPPPINVILEVQQHIGEGRVRCVAMESTEGMVRGMKVIDLGGPITVPVGTATLGRILNVIGLPGGRAWSGQREGDAADPSPGALFRRAGHRGGDV